MVIYFLKHVTSAPIDTIIGFFIAFSIFWFIKVMFYFLIGTNCGRRFTAITKISLFVFRIFQFFVLWFFVLFIHLFGSVLVISIFYALFVIWFIIEAVSSEWEIDEFHLPYNIFIFEKFESIDELIRQGMHHAQAINRINTEINEYRKKCLI